MLNFRDLCGLLLCGLVFARGAAAADRPNIVLILSDDLAYQAVSAYGEKRALLKTPQMDALAEQGARFDRCLVTNSICGPSRAVILTGKYSHRNGFYNNSGQSRFDNTQQTFPRLLQAAGYTTAVIGKWHLNSDPVGFDYWNILPGQGVYYQPVMIEGGKKVQHAGYVTDAITESTLNWLKQRDKSRPFLLMMQHKAPHRPWDPDVQSLTQQPDHEYPLPETLFDDYRNRPFAVADTTMTIAKHFTDRDVKLQGPPLNEAQQAVWNAYYQSRNRQFQGSSLQGHELVRARYQRYMHDYLSCVKSVDDSVGQLLHQLEEEGIADQTLVICTSDQGFYLGEHGWYDKRWIFEESLRTPFLVRWPGMVQPGTVNSDLVSLLDLAQTFCEVAGVPIPSDMQGHSLVPLLQGKKPADWRSSFYYSYYEYPNPHHVRPHYGVVTDRYKLFHIYGDADDWVLLDRVTDPQELKNVHDDPARAGVVRELRAELTRLRAELGETTLPPREAFGNLKADITFPSELPR